MEWRECWLGYLFIREGEREKGDFVFGWLLKECGNGSCVRSGVGTEDCNGGVKDGVRVG